MRRDLLAVAVVVALAAVGVLALQSRHSSAQSADPVGRYQAALDLRGDDCTYHVIDTTTGEVWLVTDTDGWASRGSPSTEAGPVGRYQLQTLGHPRKELTWVYVLDTQTGRTWYHTSQGWGRLGQPPE